MPPRTSPSWRGPKGRGEAPRLAEVLTGTAVRPACPELLRTRLRPPAPLPGSIRKTNFAPRVRAGRTPTAAALPSRRRPGAHRDDRQRLARSPHGAPGMPLGSETPTSPVRSALCFSRRRSPLLLPFTPSIPASPVVSVVLLGRLLHCRLLRHPGAMSPGPPIRAPQQSRPSLLRSSPLVLRAFKTRAMRALGDYVTGDAEQTSCGFALAAALRGPGKAGVIGNCSSQRGNIRQVRGAREVGDHSR